MLFHLINETWTNPLIDLLMPALSWIGKLGAVWIALLAALAIGFVLSTLIKDITMRPRPFVVLDHVRLLAAAPRSYAFPSGHTTSAFAASSAAVLAAKRLLGRVPVWCWGMLALAAAISYSRLYVGVHWPTDVAAGVVLGLASGWAGFRLALGRWGPKSTEQPEDLPQVQSAS